MPSQKSVSLNVTKIVQHASKALLRDRIHFHGHSTANFWLMRQHSQGAEQTFSTTNMNGHWRITMLLDGLYFNKDLVSMFGPEMSMNWTICDNK
jgi:hypothetical protein